MATCVGVGRSKDLDPFRAGSSAAKMAMDKAGVKKCDFVFLFSTTGYDQDAMLKGVRSITGEAPLSGCSGEGLITQDGPEGEVGFALSGAEKTMEIVGVMIFASNEISFSNFAESGLKRSSFEAGENIGKTINRMSPGDSRILLLFPDVYSVNIHKLFKGIDAEIERPILCCGGASGHNMRSSQITYQYHNGKVLQDSVPGVLISGNIKFELAVSHGCVPIGIEKTVTKAKDNIIYEIENKTAWKFYQEYVGEDIEQLDSEIAPSLSFGVKLPDELSTEFDRYILRAPLMANPDGSILFSAEIEEGTKVQLVRRDEDKISRSAAAMARRIRTTLDGKQPIAVLHFDCAGRGKMFFGDDVKEKSIDVLQNEFDKDVPWLGFFCFGEIAPVHGINHFHNHTVALCVIYK